MPSIHYDPKLVIKIKKEAAKKTLKKLKDAAISTTKGDLHKAKKDLKEAAHEYSKCNVVFRTV